jgi:THO complex subunit 1
MALIPEATGAAADDSMQVDDEYNMKLKPQNPNYLTSLEEPLRSIAASAIPAADATATATATAAVRADHLEIQLRQHLFQFVQQAITHQDSGSDGLRSDINVKPLGVFWRSSLELCLHLVYFSEHDNGSDERYQGMDNRGRKLPLVLLEEALDTLPVQQCQQLWESYVEPAYDVLFSPLLWTPSTSKSHPCWLPFIKLANKLLRRLQSGDWAARLMLTLAKVFPLSEKSAIKVWGSYHADSVTDFETAQEFEEQQQQATPVSTATAATMHDAEDDGAIPDYTFYESFWSLQHDFSNPSKISVADFLNRVRSLVQGLESHALMETPTATASTTAATMSTSTSLSKQPTKYLTSSRLLHIQLSDPDFRIHVLTQLLISAHHLQSEIPVLGTKLADSLTRAKELLRRIRPDGPTHLKLLEYVLESSEKTWRQWKKNKCQPDLDATLSDPVVQKNGNGDNDAANGSRKRNLNGDAAADTHKNDDEEEEEAYQLIVMKTELPLISQKMRKVVPTLESHFEDFVEALDPDSGIEAEYHPKNDRVFCWRALRLLSNDHLEVFSTLRPNGDLEPAIRQIYKEEKGVDIPGECHKDVHEEEEEEEEEVVEEVEEKVEQEEAKEETEEVPEADDEEKKRPLADSDVDVEMVDNGDSTGDDGGNVVFEHKEVAESSQDDDVAPMDEEAKKEDQVDDDDGEIEEGETKVQRVSENGDGTHTRFHSPPTKAEEGLPPVKTSNESTATAKKDLAVAASDVPKGQAASTATASTAPSLPSRNNDNDRSRHGGPRGPGQRGGPRPTSGGQHPGDPGDRRQDSGPGRNSNGADGPPPGRHVRDGPGRDGSGSGPGRQGYDGGPGRGGGGPPPRGDRRDDRREGDRPGGGSRRGGPPMEGDRREPERDRSGGGGQDRRESDRDRDRPSGGGGGQDRREPERDRSGGGGRRGQGPLEERRDDRRGDSRSGRHQRR